MFNRPDKPRNLFYILLIGRNPTKIHKQQLNKCSRKLDGVGRRPSKCLKPYTTIISGEKEFKSKTARYFLNYALKQTLNLKFSNKKKHYKYL